MPEIDHDYQPLRQITDQPTASQRGLAARLGVSVGKVNYCLRARVGKGWVKANNLRRSDIKLAYAYLLTPRGAGIRELAETIAQVTGYFGTMRCDVSKPDGTPFKPMSVSRLGALGWETRVSLLQGLTETYRWYFVAHAKAVCT